MSDFDALIAYFERFPGVGTRQAKRFAFHILTMPRSDVRELSRLIANLDQSVARCSHCHRFFSYHQTSDTCPICLDSSRDATKLLVVVHDSDIQAIERSDVYNGHYFVLGGTVPLLTEDTPKHVRGKLLYNTIEKRLAEGLKEVILGLPVNPDGENTGRYIEHLVADLVTSRDLHVSYLGRGLSTGSELEYADRDTIKNAFINRGQP